MLPLQVGNELITLILFKVGVLAKPGLLVWLFFEDWLFPAHFPHRLSVTWPKPCVCLFEQVLFSLWTPNSIFFLFISPIYILPKAKLGFLL